MNNGHVGKIVDGRYRLDRILGEGAAGAVYAATQLSVDRTVAVKLLHATNAARFTAEAKAIARLNHTNVITLHDFGFDSELGAHFMVTEYAEGVPLSVRMREVMSTDLILGIALEIASAMHHAHANGISHRDLKPENVILTRADGRVDVAKVLDFGLAHLIDDSVATPDEADDLTRPMEIAPAVTAETTADSEPILSDPRPPSLDDLEAVASPDDSAPVSAAPDQDQDQDEDEDEDEDEAPPAGASEDEVVETAVLRKVDVSEDIVFGDEE